MALNFSDGFDSYAATADLIKKWPIVGANWAFNSTGGRFGGGGVVSTGAGTMSSLQGIPSSNSSPSFDFGFYFKASAPPASQAIILQAVGSSVVAQMGLTTSGGLYTSAWTDTLNVCDNNWHWIEIQFGWGAPNTILYIDNLLRQNNGTETSFAALSYINLIGLAGITMSFDDLIEYDSTTTGAPNNGNYPLGARQIITTRPSSDGTVGFGTVVGGTGSHASCVNETAPDGDTSYVQDGGATTSDLYNFGSLGSTPANITAVMLNIYLENPGGGSININATCKSGATTGNKTAVITPLMYGTKQFAYGTDPNTSAAWTVANLNAAQFGPLNA